jgi:predicted nucleic acid-binding protein
MGGKPQQDAPGEIQSLILVDTSVWIEFFKDTKGPETRFLIRAIEDEEDLCTCGPVLQEVLQGIRIDADHARVREYLSSLVYLPVGRATYLDAAALYRRARKKGETVRKPVDCVIASCAISQSVFLLERDGDFDSIARYSTLRLCL